MDLTHWQQHNTITLIASDGEEEYEYRLTFKTMSAFDESIFKRKRVNVFAILSELFGPLDERNEEQMEQSDVMLDILVKHAAVMTALEKVEAKQGKTWKETKLPDVWYQPREFAYHVPHSVLELLFSAVIDAGNPFELFSFIGITDEQKKTVRIPVNTSAS